MATTAWKGGARRAVAAHPPRTRDQEDGAGYDGCDGSEERLVGEEKDWGRAYCASRSAAGVTSGEQTRRGEDIGRSSTKEGVGWRPRSNLWLA